ncbi:hypothetical protein [Filimonas zeae]|nr:hypothetical protein [Filimonas zeae]
MAIPVEFKLNGWYIGNLLSEGIIRVKLPEQTMPEKRTAMVKMQ